MYVSRCLWNFGEFEIDGAHEDGIGLIMCTIIIKWFRRSAMLRCRKFLISTICLFSFGITFSSYAEEEIEDLIDIAESSAFTEINLRTNESIVEIKLTI